jgi:hypothetical protein
MILFFLDKYFAYISKRKVLEKISERNSVVRGIEPFEALAYGLSPL